jgi:hypothetical protein
MHSSISHSSNHAINKRPMYSISSHNNVGVGVDIDAGADAYDEGNVDAS